jgi:pimeloyl-ACP methyl ester carboxylesterase
MKKIILLHNGFDNKKTWDPIIPLLQSKFSVLRYDRKGYGENFSQAPKPNEDLIANGVKELEEFISKETEANESVVLWGHCIGGAIACSYASKHPQKVKALIGEAVGFYSNQTISTKAQWLQVDYSEIPQTYVQFFSKMHGSANAREVWNRIREHNSIYLYDPNYSILDQLAKIEVSSFFFQGDKDVYFSKNYLNLVKLKLPEARYKIIPQGKHDLHTQDPQGISSIVLDFLATNL